MQGGPGPLAVSLWLAQSVILGVLLAEWKIRRLAGRTWPRWTIGRGMGIVALCAFDASLVGRNPNAGAFLVAGLLLTTVVACVHLLARALARWMRGSPDGVRIDRTDLVAVSILTLVGVALLGPVAIDMRFRLVSVIWVSLSLAVFFFGIVTVEGSLLYLGGLARGRIIGHRSDG